MTGSCEPPNLGTRSQTSSSEEQEALSTSEASLAPVDLVTLDMVAVPE